MKSPIISLVILVFALAATLAASPLLSSAQTWLNVKSSLAGRVLADHLVKEGDQVDSGQPLVYVRTALTGTIGVAARAPHGGSVHEVLVKPGQHVERGAVVVRLQPK
jgi:biotin carboxyl carrier protein